MNYIWSLMIIISLVYSFFFSDAQQTLSAGITAAADSIQILLSFAGIMCLWSGILNLCDKCGISSAIEKALSPILGLLFKNLKDENAKKLMTMNITANLLGTGNAATPPGIAAMQRLDKLNGCKKSPSKDMCTFAILNTCALSIVPSTTLSILAGGGCGNPSAIIIPVWIVSAITLFVGLGAVKILCRHYR